jgi:hypothetical protein
MALGYRSKSTHKRLPLVESLRLLNAALEVERLVKEGRNEELQEFLHTWKGEGA